VRRADSLLAPFVREFGIEAGVRLAEMKRDWCNLFQKPLSSHMSPSFLSHEDLLISVDSPVWLQELNFCKGDIMKKLSAYGVKAVRFKLGRVLLTEQSGTKRGKKGIKTLEAGELSFIEKALSPIHDSELKEVVEKTIGKALATGKTKVT